MNPPVGQEDGEPEQGLLPAVLGTEVTLVATWTVLYVVHGGKGKDWATSRVLDCVQVSAKRDLFLVDRSTAVPEVCHGAPFYAHHPVWYSLVLGVVAFAVGVIFTVWQTRRGASARPPR